MTPASVTVANMRSSRVTRYPRAGLWLCFFLCLSVFSQAQTPVVIVTLDTTRADHLGIYGYTKARTPNLDSFARQGAVFEQAITPVPITLPAHCSLFTGTYPLYHGVREFATSRLRSDLTTLAEIFREHDYKTAAFIGSEALHSIYGLKRGFEIYDENFLEVTASTGAERKAEAVVESALGWLKKNQAPYFLWIHLFDPHDPYTPPEPFATQFSQEPYDGEIAYMDQQFGRLWKALPSETVVVVVGDHGESLGEHGEKYHGIFIYDATVRVPLFIHIPGVLPRRISQQVGLIDIMPTLLQLLQWKIPNQVQGKSFLNLIRSRGRYQEEPAYTESFYSRIHMGWSELQGYRTSDFKFIRAPREELYDLKKDPGETKNLRASQQALALQHQAQLESLVKKYSVPLPESKREAALDRKQLEKLRALGYVARSSSRSDAQTPPFEGADPKDKILLFNTMTEAVRLSNSETSKSIDLLKQVLIEDPKIAVAHYMLGRNYMKLKRYIQALEEFRETLKLTPDYVEAAYQLALAYANLDQFDDAITGFRRVTQMNSQYYKAYHQLAAAQLRRDQVEEAVRNLETAVRIEPRFAVGRNDLARLYLFRNQHRKAIQELEAAIQADPRLVPAYFNLGTAYLRVGEKQKAKKAYARAKELNPKLNIPQIP
ncbi:sulfatase-like hydrolase/transferase [Acidobacteria bacterium AH-259-D05]|nr:sulfatase-like hydrolase/transferase [Acidobacteria bacterium AH-259-D05]